VPGAVVTDDLVRLVEQEWQDSKQGRIAAIERAAKTAAVLKGIGYKGIHIGGIHRDFNMVGQILDRIAVYENQWQDIVAEVHFPKAGSFYAFAGGDGVSRFGRRKPSLGFLETLHFSLLNRFHEPVFQFGPRDGALFEKNRIMA
jgi:methylenetetrahydrofolate reductase (NADPH)